MKPYSVFTRSGERGICREDAFTEATADMGLDGWRRREKHPRNTMLESRTAQQSLAYSENSMKLRWS